MPQVGPDAADSQCFDRRSRALRNPAAPLLQAGDHWKNLTTQAFVQFEQSGHAIRIQAPWALIHRATPSCGKKCTLAIFEQLNCLHAADRRELVEKKIQGVPTFDIVEQGLDWHSRAGEAWSAAENLGINPYHRRRQGHGAYLAWLVYSCSMLHESLAASALARAVAQLENKRCYAPSNRFTPAFLAALRRSASSVANGSAVRSASSR